MIIVLKVMANIDIMPKYIGVIIVVVMIIML